MRRLPGGGFEAGNVTPRDLIMVAYDIQRFFLVAVPSWAETERFDISARAGASPPPGANADMLMLRALLEDRFRLAVHTETRDVQVYALVLVRRDGQLGPQLRRSQTDCTAAASSARGTAPPPGAAGVAQCGSRNGPGFISGVGREVSSLLFPLGGYVQRPVVDRTGLTGTWDVELKFNPEGFIGGAAAPPSPQDSGPSLFTALQEQLGLRLEPSTGPVQVLVIDRIERPAEN